MTIRTPVRHHFFPRLTPSHNVHKQHPHSSSSRPAIVPLCSHHIILPQLSTIAVRFNYFCTQIIIHPLPQKQMLSTLQRLVVTPSDDTFMLLRPPLSQPRATQPLKKAFPPRTNEHSNLIIHPKKPTVCFRPFQRPRNSSTHHKNQGQESLPLILPVIHMEEFWLRVVLGLIVE